MIPEDGDVVIGTRIQRCFGISEIPHQSFIIVFKTS